MNNIIEIFIYLLRIACSMLATKKYGDDIEQIKKEIAHINLLIADMKEDYAILKDTLKFVIDQYLNKINGDKNEESV